MSNAPNLVDIIANAISRADSSYFNENYTKQAQAVLAAVEKAGYALTRRDLPESLWEEAAEKMQTGRMKPHEHVKDVYLTVLKIIEKP